MFVLTCPEHEIKHTTRIERTTRWGEPGGPNMVNQKTKSNMLWHRSYLHAADVKRKCAKAIARCWPRTVALHMHIHKLRRQELRSKRQRPTKRGKASDLLTTLLNLGDILHSLGHTSRGLPPAHVCLDFVLGYQSHPTFNARRMYLYLRLVLVRCENAWCLLHMELIRGKMVGSLVWAEVSGHYNKICL